MLDHLTPEEARPNLEDLIRINRRFGGHSVLRKILEGVVGHNDRFTMLDVGAASGDAARLVQEHYPGASVTSLDCSPVNLAWAPQPKIVADAFRLPLAPGSFDFVMASLFLHHFEDEQVVGLLSRFHTVARRAVLISDLERHIFPYLFLSATKRLLRWNDVTVHDGAISVRASFRASELLQLACRAGIQNAEVCVHRPAFRISLVAMKNGAG